MSRKRILAALAFLCATPAFAGAQTIQELEERLARQQAELAVAEEQLRIADSIRAANQPVSRFYVGPVHVIATQSQEEFARRLVSEAWSAYEDAVGDAVDPFETSLLILVEGQEEAIPFIREPNVEIHFDSTDSREQVVRVIRNRIGTELTDRLPERLREFVSSSPWPIEPARTRGELYDQIVLTASRASRQCYQLDADGCWDAMGAGESTDWEDIYDPEDLEELVRSWRRPESYTSADARQAYDGCLNAHRVENCITWLERRGEPKVPFGFQLRRDLLRYAISRGGAGAYTRALTLDGNVTEALVSIAGIGSTDLMSGWIGEVIESGTSRRTNNLMLAITSLVWIGLLGLLVKGASRWS